MENINSTINYYNENAGRYCQETFNAKMTSLQCEFLLRLPHEKQISLNFIFDFGKKTTNALINKDILDLGCGSGRDSKFFKNYGCKVIAVDGSAEMCKLAEKNIGQPVIYNDLREYEPETPVAGIWANASLLHLTREEIKDNVIRLTKHLLPVGCFYMSFKYGNFSGERDGRFYTDFDETSLQRMLHDIPSLSLVRYTISEDVCSNHSGEKWLNIFCMKKSPDDKKYAYWKNEAISDDYFLKLCETGNFYEIIKAVREGANLHAKDNKGRSYHDILRERRQNGAFVTFASSYSLLKLGCIALIDFQTDLIFRAVKKEDLEVVRTFLELGIGVYKLCYVRQHGGYYGSAFALAVENKNFEIVKTMLEYGVNVKEDVEENKNYSALATAISCRNTDMLKFFLDYHRSSDIETKHTLAGFALVSAARQEDTKMIKFLLEYGIDINTFNITYHSKKKCFDDSRGI